MNRIYGKERAKEHIPSYAMKVVEDYEGKIERFPNVCSCNFIYICVQLVS